VDLRVRLRRAGLSQQDLAQHLGVSAAFLSAALSDKKPWPPGMRERAEAFVAGGAEGLVAGIVGEAR
jgi:transcriptional regulator with XRE-family HTH domain